MREEAGQVAAAPPHLLLEERPKAFCLTQMGRSHVRIVGDPVACAQPIAEVDVLAGGKRLVESTDLPECRAPDGEVLGREPFHASALVPPMAVVRPNPLHPGRSYRRVGRRACSAYLGVGEVDDALLEPVGRDDAIRIDECKELALGTTDPKVPQPRD